MLNKILRWLLDTFSTPQPKIQEPEMPTPPPAPIDAEYEGVENNEPTDNDIPERVMPEPTPEPPTDFLSWLQGELDKAGIRNFTAREVCPIGRIPSGGGAPLKKMPREYVGTVIRLARVLEWLRNEAGGTPLRISSWYRDPDYNRAVSPNAPNSMHITGGAADISHATLTPAQIYALLDRHPYTKQLGLGRYRTFVHVDIRGLIGRAAPARW